MSSPDPGPEAVAQALHDGVRAPAPVGDRSALPDRGRSVLRLHLTDRAAGLEQILEAVRR